MSRGEIGARLSDAAVRWREQRAWRSRGASDRPAQSALPVTGLLPRAALLVPGAVPHQLLALKSAFPDLHRNLEAQALARATAILAGECELLGFSADLRGKVDWHRDPRSSHRWPRQFYSSLDLYELPDGIDVKYVWELNRHQLLVELSRGWLFSGDDRFAARVRELILDWIEQNPLYEGVNWTSALEASVRGISWLWALAGLAEWPGWRDDDCRRIAHSLLEHARYLSQHLSFYSSPYNHLIGEAAGLYILGAWLDGFPQAGAWRERGREVLREHGPRQFYADGFCVEQATGYHFFTLGFLVHALATSCRIDEPLDELRPVVAQAFAAGAAFIQPGGTWPAIGDVDSARALPVSPANFWDFRSLYGLGAALCDRPDLAAVAGGPGAELYWLEAATGIDKAFAPRAEQAPVVRDEATGDGRSRAECRLAVLPEAGYCVVRSGDCPHSDWLLLDCGPIAHGLFSDGTPSTAHGHADALQVLLCLRGNPVLVDPGMPYYFGPRQWVDHFRGAGAHNTVEIEGRPVARHSGRLGWSHVCHEMRIQASEDSQGAIVAGRVDLGGGNSITRSARLIAGQGAWIADLIETDGPREVRWSWQVRDSLVLHGADQEAHGLRCGDLWIGQWNSKGPVPLSFERANGDGPGAWHCPGYGQRTSGQRILSRETVAGRGLVATYVGVNPPLARIRVGEDELVCAGRIADERGICPQIDLTALPSGSIQRG